VREKTPDRINRIKEKPIVDPGTVEVPGYVVCPAEAPTAK